MGQAGVLPDAPMFVKPKGQYEAALMKGPASGP
jgi:hypothetical protein